MAVHAASRTPLGMYLRGTLSHGCSRGSYRDDSIPHYRACIAHRGEWKWHWCRSYLNGRSYPFPRAKSFPYVISDESLAGVRQTALDPTDELHALQNDPSEH